MAIDTAILFPGQGAYAAGVLAGHHGPDVAEVLGAVDRVAAAHGRRGVSGYLTSAGGPSAAELVRSDPFSLQLAVFAIGMAGARITARVGAASVYVGHSMGEIAALTAAGAFDVADGARLIAHRAEALAAHCPRPGGMVALHLPAQRAAHLVGLIGDRELAVAVTNAPRQTVVAGPETALDAVIKLADALGVHATRLHAPFPFHTPMLGVAGEQFAAAIAQIPQRALRHPVYSPVLGGYVSDTTDAKALLVRQLTTPVMFMAAVRELHADGVRRFVEGTPAGLGALVRACVPDVVAGPAAELGDGAAVAPSIVAPAVAPAVASAVASPVTAHVVAPAPAATPAPAIDVATVLAQLRNLYASTLGYPEEAITATADLEADLGIDSLKRAEMLSKIVVHFNLNGAVNHRAFANHQTLQDLAELVVTAHGAA